MISGVVYRSTGSWYSVKTDRGFINCRIKGKLRLKGLKSTNPIAVGDLVTIQLSQDGQQTVGTISEIHERQNYIVRKSVNLSKQTHIIAANIDQVFLLVTLNNPPTSSAFIDRFLVTAEAYQIPAVLLFNKMDSYDEQEKILFGELKNTYEKIAYPCYDISALHGWDTVLVKKLMQGKVSMFSGHSGVGKSTLVNALAPGLQLRTAQISEQHQQGQHTTTFAEMFDLDDGIKIIDTPGIKGFGVVDMEMEEVGMYFPEFLERKSACKFNNCTHTNEPKCAVITAVENGEIATSRYKSYLQIISSDNLYRS